jgi:hypothetical protein
MPIPSPAVQAILQSAATQLQALITTGQTNAAALRAQLATIQSQIDALQQQASVLDQQIRAAMGADAITAQIPLRNVNLMVSGKVTVL